MTVVETGNMATYKDVQHNIILDNINALKTTSGETTSMQMHQDDSTCERLSATSESTMAARVKTPDHPWRSGWLRKAGVNTRSHLVQPLPSRETTSMPTHKDAQDNIIRDNIHALKTTSGGTTSMQMHQDDSTGERLSATSESTTAARVKTPDHPWRSGWLRKAGVQLEKHTVDVNDIEDGFPDQEFQEKTRQIKIIELKEAKQALREALIRDEQKVDHERDRQVMRSDCKASIDKHEASVADNKFIRCAKNESRVSCARHSVARNTLESSNDQPEGSKPNTKAGFFKSLAKSIRTKREEAMTRQARQEILELLLIE